MKGTVAYGLDTVAAAETVASLASTLDQALFPFGSDVPESRVKPAIFTANHRADQLIAAVQAASVELVPAVKSGDKTKIAAAYAAVDNACSDCHREFRKDE